MSGFVDTALGFPAVVLSFLLVVVIAYWIVAMVGAVDMDDLDAGGFADFLSGIGLRGVPVAVSLSLLIAFAWFVGLIGTYLIAGLPGVLVAVLGVVVLAGALVAGWAAARVLVKPLRRALPDEAGASRWDFVGRPCVIRTGRVGPDFGQAEVTAEDGSSAIVQVRQAADAVDAGRLRAGSTALIYDYDEAGEYFWVMPADPSLR
jgi:hypothetical protein